MFSFASLLLYFEEKGTRPDNPYSTFDSFYVVKLCLCIFTVCYFNPLFTSASDFNHNRPCSSIRLMSQCLQWTLIGFTLKKKNI